MSTATLEEVIHPSTLYEAWERVRANDGVGGVDRVSLNDFEADLDSNIQTLINEIKYETYRPLPLLRVEIDKPDGGKRPLSIPTIRDRVLQTAIALVLTPVFEQEFEDISFAYRTGRSVDQAVRMGHPALASDLMEEFRSIVVDAVVLNIVFNNKLTPDDFEYPKNEEKTLAEKKPCLLKPKARGVFIHYLEKKLNAGITHPVSNLKLDYRRCMEHQVNHLATIIREKETSYKPIILK